MKKYSRFSKLFAVLLAVAMVLPGIAQAAPAVEDVIVKRIAGERRIETAIKASQEAYEDDGANIAVLAGYSGEVDALTGTLLAGNKKAPLLLTEKNKVPTNLKEELKRLGVEAVYILGGETVVSVEVEKELKKHYVVERVSGDNRAETADAVAKRTMRTADHAFLALGYNEQLADALAIGPVSAIKNEPVLLTKTNSLPKETIETLEYLKVKEVTIVGGKTAVNENVVKELEDMNITTDRVEGLDRYKTAVAIAERYFDKPENTIVAYGWKYADALVGGYLGAVKNAPILLTKSNVLNPDTKGYLEDKAYNVFVLGGETVINKSVYEEIKASSILTTNEKEATKAVAEFEAKLQGKDKVVELVNKDELREEVSKSRTDVFNMVQKVENKEVKDELLARLDVAHDRLIAATSVKGLIQVTKDGVTEDNLDTAKIKLSNAKRSLKDIKDDATKNALEELIKPEEAKIETAEALKAVNTNLTLETLEENAAALGLDTTEYKKLKADETYGQERVGAVVLDIKANKGEDDYTAESFKKYFNAAVKNRRVYAQSMDYVNKLPAEDDLEVDKFITNVIAVLEETKTDLPLQHKDTKIEEVVIQMKAVNIEYNNLPETRKKEVLDAVKAVDKYNGYSQILGTFTNEVRK